MDTQKKLLLVGNGLLMAVLALGCDAEAVSDATGGPEDVGGAEDVGEDVTQRPVGAVGGVSLVRDTVMTRGASQDGVKAGARLDRET